MYARSLAVSVRPGKLDEAVAFITGPMAQVMLEIPGAVRAALLFDRASNQIMTVSLWETAEARENSETNGVLRSELAKLAPLLDGAPAREHLDVMFRIPIEGTAIHARTVTGQVMPGQEEAVSAIYREVAAGLKQQPGFAAALLLTDRGTGKGVSITAWESADAMQASAAGPEFRAAIAKITEQFAGPPQVRSWEMRPLR